MKTPLDDLKYVPPAAPERAKQEAWKLAASEFQRGSDAEKNAEKNAEEIAARATPIKFGFTGLITMIAAALAIVAAVMVFLRTPDSASGNLAERHYSTEIFEEGIALFGSRLKAVTVSNEGVTWHLSEVDPLAPSSQLIRVILHSDEEMIVRAGQVVPVTFEGETVDLEFLENVDGNIVALGDDVLWVGNEPGSPILNASLTEPML